MLLNIDPRSIVLFGIITTVMAQILLKHAGTYNQFSMIWIVHLSLSGFLYFFSFIFYYFSLKVFDISTVQPIMMVTIVALVSIYGFLSGEKFNYFKVCGIFAAMFSVLLISKG